MEVRVVAQAVWAALVVEEPVVLVVLNCLLPLQALLYGMQGVVAVVVVQVAALVVRMVLAVLVLTLLECQQVIPELLEYMVAVVVVFPILMADVLVV